MPTKSKDQPELPVAAPPPSPPRPMDDEVAPPPSPPGPTDDEAAPPPSPPGPTDDEVAPPPSPPGPTDDEAAPPPSPPGPTVGEAAPPPSPPGPTVGEAAPPPSQRTPLERARLKARKARERLAYLETQDRKKADRDATRRKIILGGQLLSLAEREPSRFVSLVEELIERLERDQDQRMFVGWNLPTPPAKPQSEGKGEAKP